MCSAHVSSQAISSEAHLRNAGLGSGFSAGTIYCSRVTANLLIRDMRVNPGCIQALPLDTELCIEGISVTLIDANHCPGAVLLLFKTSPPKGCIYKHEVTSSVLWYMAL